MAKPLTPIQRQENAAFLRQLRATGNAREAARRVGRAYGTMQHRRAQHPSFAAGWDAALAFAQARLARGGAQRPRGAGAKEDPAAHRTKGGEPVVIRRRDGTLQMRRAQPGKLTRQCEQAFLLSLSATANVSLSAAAAGAAEAAFYRRKRTNPAFAREWGEALREGWKRLEGALIESIDPASGDDMRWRHNEPPPLPPITANQALQLMFLHQKEARWWSERPYFRRRGHEPQEAMAARVAAVYLNRLVRHAEDRAAEKVMGDTARDIDPRVAEPPIVLPDFAVVRTRREKARSKAAEAQPAGGGASPCDGEARTRRASARSETGPARPAGGTASPSDDAGFTPASGPKVYDESRALFGGWRIADMERKRRGE